MSLKSPDPIEGTRYTASIGPSLAAMTNPPDELQEIPPSLQEFFARLERLLGNLQAREVLNTMRQPKRRGFWVNALRQGRPLQGAVRLPGVPDFWTLAADGDLQLGLDPQVGSGEVYPLNPSSVLAVLALAPQADEELLDLAAAPGGKTLLMAAAMNNSGRIAAVEPVKPRFHRLRANLARCGARNVAFYLADGRGVGAKVPGRFDGVLLDAPCSSEARMRLAEPDTFAHWKPRKIKEASRKQRRLLRSGYAALKVGGRLIYSTCAFAPEENEANVDYLLTREPGAEIVPLHLPAGPLREGTTQWRGRAFHPSVRHCVRVMPDDLWDGFFVAKIVKRS